MAHQDILLDMQGISKTFPGVKALNKVNFQVRKGEVMALLGENGAGKSTLIKIITGYYHRDPNQGVYIFDGQHVNPANTLAAQKMGIGTIYQELNLSPYQSIAENIFLGNQPRKHGSRGAIDWDKMNQMAEKEMAKLGIHVDVTQLIQNQSAAVRQMTSIARALTFNTKLLIMDEATSSLDENEVENLFRVIRELKEKGMSIIFVTHKLDEVYKLCDRGTILKDGQFVTCKQMSELPKDELIAHMVGRDATNIINKKKVYSPELVQADSCFSLRNIRKTDHRLNGVDLDIKCGEVLGLAGLLGSGRTELAKVIFGDDQDYSGETFMGHTAVKFRSPRDAVKKKLAFCSEDRKTEGIFPYMSIEDNLVMPQIGKISKFGFINTKKNRKLCEQYMQTLAIKAPNSKTPIRNLSGGNQQKVIFSRWLAMNPDLIILDEPTRGIDVGAKSEIEKLIGEISASGISILYISSEIEELVRNCDRVVILYEGQKVEELIADAITSKNIMSAIARGTCNSSITEKGEV